MSEHPAKGMYYELGRKKLKGRLGKDPQIRDSILNQVQLHEGETARVEIQRELSLIEKGSSAFSGAGNVQSGIGDGDRLEDGHWKYSDGKWNKV
jgi:hypothetical protein